MPSKKRKSALTNLPEKSIDSKDASSVKGGLRAREGRLASNHNQTLRGKKGKSAITSLPEKPVGAKDASAVKGGRTKEGRLATNHNQTLRRQSAR